MAVARQPNSPVLGGADIVQLAENRINAFSDRNAWYSTLESYYYGPDGPTSFGPSVKPMNAQGRPILRDGELGGSVGRQRAFSTRRLSGVVDDFASLKGRMPISRSEPPTPDENGQQIAEKITKYLYSTYELSKLPLQQADAGHHLSMLGDSLYVLEPGVEGDSENRVIWTVVHPATGYPNFRRGFLRSEMYDLALIETWTPEEIRLTWGIKVLGDKPSPEDCRVVTYISPWQRTIVVGTDRWKVVKHAEWNLGFCPAQWIFNKPGGQMGMSDIGNALDQQDLLDHALNVWADGIVQMTYPLMVVKGDRPSGGENAPILGPGAPPYYAGRDGGVEAVTVGGNPASLQQIIGETINEMNASTGSSQVRQEGQMHGSIQTGRAIQAAQGPASTRLEAFHETFAAAWRELNAKTLKMQEKAPVLKNWEGDIYGRLKGVNFNEQMSAKDIGGWYRTTVVWDANLGLSAGQKLQIAAEGKQFGLWDTPYAMEQVGVDDPQAMHKRVQAEKQHEMEMAQPKPLGQPPSPGGGRQAGVRASQPGGLAGAPANHPLMIARPFHMGQAQPKAVEGGVPVGTSRKAVEEKLAAVAGKLKGEVYAVGDLATSGQSQQVTLAITAAADHRKVVEATRSLGNVKVRHVSSDKLPTEAVRVA